VAELFAGKPNHFSYLGAISHSKNAGSLASPVAKAKSWFSDRREWSAWPSRPSPGCWEAGLTRRWVGMKAQPRPGRSEPGQPALAAHGGSWIGLMDGRREQAAHPRGNQLGRAGTSLNRPRKCEFRPGKAEIDLFWPASENIGQKNTYVGREVSELTPGPHMSAA
jgi:hypothetical protein